MKAKIKGIEVEVENEQELANLLNLMSGEKAQEPAKEKIIVVKESHPYAHPTHIEKKRRYDNKSTDEEILRRMAQIVKNSNAPLSVSDALSKALDRKSSPAGSELKSIREIILKNGLRGCRIQEHGKRIKLYSKHLDLKKMELRSEEEKIAIKKKHTTGYNVFMAEQLSNFQKQGMDRQSAFMASVNAWNKKKAEEKKQMASAMQQAVPWHGQPEMDAKREFYIQPLLKFFRSEDEAIKLIKTAPFNGGIDFVQFSQFARYNSAEDYVNFVRSVIYECRGLDKLAGNGKFVARNSTLKYEVGK